MTLEDPSWRRGSAAGVKRKGGIRLWWYGDGWRQEKPIGTGTFRITFAYIQGAKETSDIETVKKR